jgi:DNA-binding CsgD family transcriptional regulator/tetratricopeptide (TPR) repeat protein
VRKVEPGRPSLSSVSRQRISPNPAARGIGCFVGRQHELSELLRLLQGAERGTGSIAVLEGEPGIGKTGTAEEFAIEARSRGATVLWGRCFEGEECPPYGPWITALRPAVRSADLRELRRTMGEGAADIAEILPELRNRMAAPELPVRLPSADGEYRLFSSLISFLRAAARDTPLLVIFDNLHLADAGSLKFLRHLASELADSRLMILGTYRNPADERSDQLAVTVEELAKARGYCRLHLDGLGRDDVRKLLARSLSVGRLSDALVAAVHARTEGNPLFVVELARQMVLAPAPGAEPLPLPDGIRQAITRRLARLTDRCREELSIASVLGRSFDREVLLHTVDGSSPTDVDNALREAQEAAVISLEDPAVERYRFVHALVQETLREGIPAAVRIAFHLRAVQAIRQVCGSDVGARWVEILGHLLEGSAAADPDELLRCAVLAAEQAIARYAPDQALALIERTFRVWERHGRQIDPRMAPLFHLHGRILTDLQRPEEGRESLTRAFDLYLRAGDRQGAIEVARTPAMERHGAVWLSSVGGGGRGVAELRERALALAAPDSPERAWLLMQRGSRQDLRDAIAFASRTSDDRLGTIASSVLAYHELLAWDFKACEEVLEAATLMADRLGDPHHSFGCAYTRYWLGILTGRPDVALEGVRQMSGLARRCRSRRLGITVHRCMADFAGMRGDWGEARQHGEQALALMADAGPVYNHQRALKILLGVDLHTGNLKAAAKRLEALHRLVGEPAPRDLRSTVLGARIASDAGQLPPAPERFEAPPADGPLLTFIATHLLQWATVVVLHRDRSNAPFYLEAARRWSGTFLEQPTDGILGSLCDVMGRFDEAVDHFERALAFCRRAGYLPELALTCSEYADALVRRGVPGDLEHAARLLDEGLELCETLGMPPLGQRIRERRGLLGGPSCHDRMLPDGLTPREVDVLRLVARGFTNAEIAERLFISPLTVARHVHNLLEKTGMANRAEAAAYATRTGVTGR